MQIGRTLVLYRAREQRLLELLRSLALAALVPHVQRLVRGFLARECKRRCIKSAATLRVALASCVSVAQCDAAATEHGKTLGNYARLFSPAVKEIRQLRKLRTACEQWVLLEKQLEAALATYAIAVDEVAEDAAFVAVEAALLHAEQLRGVIKCTPFQQKLCALVPLLHAARPICSHLCPLDRLVTSLPHSRRQVRSRKKNCRRQR